MGKVYLIPDRNGMEQSMALIGEYNGAFEYNDFWKSDVLDDWRKQEEIIDFYAKFRTDFSQDTMHGAFLDVTVHSEDRLIREASVQRVHQSMEIAKRMGLRGVVFHTGLLAGFRIDSYLKNWLEKNVRFFTELANEYPSQQIWMENMFDEIPQELAGLGEAMKEVENFGICLDYAHGAVTDCPGEKWVKELAPYIRHMHINDNDRQRDLHLPVGNGVIDWQEYNRLMRQYQVDATVLVEVNGYEAQKKSLEYLKKHQIFPLAR
ncbi:MAG: sugar phosphate isomerase/epimerase [Lachnospiraceae bacterium]|nr:sugar phosphate isomerase/epimerase [Lachnospiraceae bacterium]